MVNKIIIVGNLGDDARTRTVGDTTVASISVAVSERFKDRNGEVQEHTEWFSCELWNAAGVAPYLKKGQQVYVEGQQRTDRWTDQDGEEHKAVKVRVQNLQLVGSRPQQREDRPAAVPQSRPRISPAELDTQDDDFPF